MDFQDRKRFGENISKYKKKKPVPETKLSVSSNDTAQGKTLGSEKSVSGLDQGEAMETLDWWDYSVGH